MPKPPPLLAVRQGEPSALRPAFTWSAKPERRESSTEPALDIADWKTVRGLSPRGCRFGLLVAAFRTLFS
eukprot:5840899-Prymnesium_polylepis.3